MKKKCARPGFELFTLPFRVAVLPNWTTIFDEFRKLQFGKSLYIKIQERFSWKCFWVDNFMVQFCSLTCWWYNKSYLFLFFIWKFLRAFFGQKVLFCEENANFSNACIKFLQLTSKNVSTDFFLIFISEQTQKMFFSAYFIEEVNHPLSIILTNRFLMIIWFFMNTIFVIFCEIFSHKNVQNYCAFLFERSKSVFSEI